MRVGSLLWRQRRPRPTLLPPAAHRDRAAATKCQWVVPVWFPNPPPPPHRSAMPAACDDARNPGRRWSPRHTATRGKCWCLRRWKRGSTLAAWSPERRRWHPPRSRACGNSASATRAGATPPTPRKPAQNPAGPLGLTDRAYLYDVTSIPDSSVAHASPDPAGSNDAKPTKNGPGQRRNCDTILLPSAPTVSPSGVRQPRKCEERCDDTTHRPNRRSSPSPRTPQPPDHPNWLSTTISPTSSYWSLV